MDSIALAEKPTCSPATDFSHWKIALLHNPRPASCPADLPDDWFEEFDGEETLAAIRGALEALGATVVPVTADRALPQRLEEGHFQFVFNIAEGTGRRCREAIPAAICELLGIPFSGSDPLTLGLALDKDLARRAVAAEVPVPRSVLVQHEEDLAALGTLRFPVIVKPNDEGSSKGIRENPIADDAAAARVRCDWLRARYGCPALVEEFLDGPEVTVGLVGNAPFERVIGLMEIQAADGDARFVYSLEAKRDWRRRVRYHVPPHLDEATRVKIERLARRAFRLLGCRDCARIDFRLDRAGQPFFLECNPLPGLNPVSSDLMLLARPTLSHERLVQEIFLAAVARTAVVRS